MAAPIAALLSLWAGAALYFDFPITRWRLPSALTYVCLATAALWVFQARGLGIVLCIGSWVVVLVWWLGIAPSNDRNWRPDEAELPWAEIHGSLVTIHNIRDFEYRTESDYTPHWETRTGDLSQILGVDLFLTHWGSPWIAHPIVSFAFADGTYLAMSIEARKETGQSYSVVRGFFRQYHLICIVAEERDVVGLRTIHRAEDKVRLYRTLTSPDDARNLFLQYLKWIESLRTQPEWYNALTRNCTTRVISYLTAAKVEDYPASIGGMC